MTLAPKVDRLVLKREKKMVVAELHVSTSSIEGDVRTLVRSNRSRSDDIVASNDAIAAGAASIADIEGGLWPNYKSPAIICKLKASACAGLMPIMPAWRRLRRRQPVSLPIASANGVSRSRRQATSPLRP